MHIFARSVAAGLVALSSLLPANAGPTPRPLSPVDSFNYVLGTQAFGAAYHFTKESALVEQARAILAMGSNTIKFALGADKNEKADPAPTNLTEVAERSPSIRAVLDMPFAHYLLWAYPMSSDKNRFQKASLAGEYREMYDLTRYLLRAYAGTSKTFYLGNWEGDWHLTHTNPKYDPTPDEVDNMTAWVNNRQRAVDDAKRDTPHDAVNVFYYLEVNRVIDAEQGKTRLTNAVLPKTNVDYVSYSSYDSLGGDIENGLKKSLDYIESQLPPKPSVPGKRVFIGEYGFKTTDHTPATQDAAARQVMRACLTWGCPFALYWEMYNNEVTPQGVQRGFWLIDDKGVKQPVYYTLQNFYAKARAYVADYERRTGHVPSRDAFGKATVGFLADPPVTVTTANGAFVDPLKDYSHLDSHTTGLMFDTTHPAFFDGRASRLRRAGADEPQNIVYKMDGTVSGLSVLTYSFGAFDGPTGPKVRLYSSPDGGKWTEIPATHGAATPTTGGWSRVRLMPAAPLAASVRYVRIELRDDPAIYSPQIGEVTLSGTPTRTQGLTIPSVLASGMVVQAGRPIRVWGRDLPGKAVTVEMQAATGGEAARRVDAMTDGDGNWLAELPAREASFTPYRIAIREGASKLVLDNVLVGEVWVAAGQSNMQLALPYIVGGDRLVADARNSHLRFFCEDHIPSPAQTGGRFGDRAAWDVAGGVWISGDAPAALAKQTVSGIGYTFAQALFGALNTDGHEVPVAVLNTATGATSIQSWLSPEALGGDPLLKARAPKDAYDGTEWSKAYNRGSLEFNYKIAPLTHFGVRGFLWAQGENDVGGADAAAYYHVALKALILDWRTRFGADDAPFLVAQIAPHYYYDDLATAAGLREAQIDACREVPKAVAMPIHDLPLTYNVGTFGYKSPIHPLDKAPVGRRLARAAEAIAYGRPVAYEGPVFTGMSVSGGVAILSFRNAGPRLRATVEGAPLRGFTICGPDRLFFPADATIDGTTVAVHSASVARPVAVAYGYTSLNEAANLANTDGLPASPFRTDRVASRFFGPQPWMACNSLTQWGNNGKTAGEQPTWQAGSADATFARAVGPGVAGKPALRLDYPPALAAGPGVAFHPVLQSPLDAGTYGGLQCNVYNPDAAPKMLALTSTTADGAAVALGPGAALPAGPGWVSVTFTFATTPDHSEKAPLVTGLLFTLKAPAGPSKGYVLFDGFALTPR
jgi:hypothetical protein